MLALFMAKSEDKINRLFDEIQEVENLADWVSFYRQKWVIASLNNYMSQIDCNIWKSSPNNTNIVEAAHALSNRRGKSLKLMSAILQKEKFTAIHIHQQYNVPNHGRYKGSISRNVLLNKCKKESSTVNKLEDQERLLAIKERELDIRELHYSTSSSKM
ncbi:hypothetical protein C2G38_2157865 [Gigaspora rosea]|uniref:Uncharacterized protein n=1 Tax=Gigaspora rosea TaxID=44941 RepID=A0A397W571_9GLOM|nr:hypothetical protein C2G38_2157865 [Gigaspora rosea]